MIDWEKYNRSQAAISGLGFVEVDIKDYEEMRAAFPVVQKALREAYVALDAHTFSACGDYNNEDVIAAQAVVWAAMNVVEKIYPE